MKRLIAYALGGGVLACLSWGSHTLTLPAGAQTPEASATAGAPMELAMGFVNYKQLLSQHPDYEKLQQMDDHIRSLAVELETLPLKERQKGMFEARKRMESEFARAHDEIMAEKAAVDGQLRSLASSLQNQISAELNEIKAKLEVDFKKQMGEIAPVAVAPPKDVGVQTQSEYQKNLQIMVQRNLTARRLELEKSMGAAVTAHRAKLDGQLAAYEDQLRAQHQDELVNLNLKVRLAKDDDEAKAVRERIEAINSEIEKAKIARRTELDGDFQSFYRDEKAKFDKDLAGYTSKIQDEVVRKLGGPPRPRPQASAQAPALPAAAQAKVKEMQARMQRELESRKAQLEARMKGEQAVAVQRLQAKQSEIQARLKLVQDELKKSLADRNRFLSKETKAKMEKLEKSLTKAREDRKTLYKTMSEQINKAVADVAQKKNVPMVIGDALYKSDALTDLTDFSMVAVKQLGK